MLKIWQGHISLVIGQSCLHDARFYGCICNAADLLVRQWASSRRDLGFTVEKLGLLLSGEGGVVVDWRVCVLVVSNVVRLFEVEVFLGYVGLTLNRFYLSPSSWPCLELTMMSTSTEPPPICWLCNSRDTSVCWSIWLLMNFSFLTPVFGKVATMNCSVDV